MAIGPEDGDIAAILNETKAGNIAGYNNPEKMKKLILDNYQSYRTGENKMKFLNIDTYSRRNLAERLAGILNELTS